MICLHKPHSHPPNEFQSHALLMSFKATPSYPFMHLHLPLYEAPHLDCSASVESVDVSTNCVAEPASYYDPLPADSRPHPHIKKHHTSPYPHLSTPTVTPIHRYPYLHNYTHIAISTPQHQHQHPTTTLLQLQQK